MLPAGRRRCCSDSRLLASPLLPSSLVPFLLLFLTQPRPLLASYPSSIDITIVFPIIAYAYRHSSTDIEPHIHDQLL